MVKRYTYGLENNAFYCRETPDGGVVSFDDYDALAAENTSLKVAEELSYNIGKKHAARVAELEARIDQLMWEFTPDEMTAEQKDRWAAHQVCSALETGAEHGS